MLSIWTTAHSEIDFIYFLYMYTTLNANLYFAFEWRFLNKIVIIVHCMYYSKKV